ncbi:hypothetical protein [Mycobacterium sp. 3519A]|uniref:hypothetical protein n=1 Tax=Mycobacterium sp. 3519A TaxID=2057184 RepID=UPI001159255E|nr:hypothetical protein [Mycobacterium sp. 3519A]
MGEALKQALERHLDEEPPRLDFSVPLDRLADSAHCKTLSDDILRAAPNGWEMVKATQSAWQKIPPTPGLYMFVWQPAFELTVATSSHARRTFPFILYVGKAGDGKNRNTLRSRYKGEYSKLVARDPERLWGKNALNTREDRLQRYLNLAPLWFWYCEVEEAASIDSLERRLFALFAPPLNTSGSPRLRAVGKPKPAF